MDDCCVKYVGNDETRACASFGELGNRDGDAVGSRSGTVGGDGFGEWGNSGDFGDIGRAGASARLG
jgi:hypothetical protein